MIMPEISCRMIQITLRHGFCEDSIVGFLQCAAVMVQFFKEESIMRQGWRIGKVIMPLLEGYSSDLTSFAYC